MFNCYGYFKVFICVGKNVLKCFRFFEAEKSFSSKIVIKIFEAFSAEKRLFRFRCQAQDGSKMQLEMSATHVGTRHVVVDVVVVDVVASETLNAKTTLATSIEVAQRILTD